MGGFIGTLLIENIVTDIDVNLIPCLVVAVTVGIVLTILCGMLVKEYYLQIYDDGFELEKGNKVTKYPFSAFKGSNVTRNYVNGFYMGTTREINITDMSGKTLNINTNNLSKGAFAELVSYLDQTKFTEAHDMEAAAEYFKEGYDFHIPSDSIIKANKNEALFPSLLTAVFLVVFLGTIIYYICEKSDSSVCLAIIVFSGLVATILLVEVISSLILYNKVKNLPNYIYVDRSSLKIENKILAADTVQSVLMVPASYNILTRDMIIITKNNEKYNFNFGKRASKDKLKYSEYAELFLTVELWCIINKVNFVKILG